MRSLNKLNKLNWGCQSDAAERRAYVNLNVISNINIHLYLRLNYGTASEHLKYSARKIYGAFVAFVGLNNNTE